MAAYADASALVKLVLPEPESDAMLRVAGDGPVLTSVIGRIELERAVRRMEEFDEARLAAVLAGVEILPVHVAISAIAGSLSPSNLRTLDAIHLASAIAMRDDLTAFYCYDERLADAAREHGLPVVAPR